MVALLEKNEASAPTLSIAVKEEEVALAVSEEVAPVASSTVAETADALAAVAETAVALPNVVDAVVVEEEAIVYPPPEELGGTDLSYLMMVMKSGNDVAYKQARLTEFVTVCMRPEYASFWRTSMHPRHNLRTIIKTSRVFGTCPVAEAFLARYPA